MQSLHKLLTVISKNAESTWTLPCVFEKCRVHMNSPLCRVCLNCCLVFKKCGVRLDSPLYFYKMCSLLEPPTVFLKMWSLHELPTVNSKKAESAWTPPCVFEKCGVQTNSPSVTHYLCVKCGELLMKVVWRAGMAMVWRLSCDQLRSKPKLSPKREK